MNEDLRRVCLWAANSNIIVPCDEEDLPCSVDSEGELVAWTGFESEELAKQTDAMDPKEHQWGMIDGLQYLKFLHERIEAGGQHVLVMNPGTDRQSALEGENIVAFLEWLEQNPTGLQQF
jgi:hypothetical protein